MNTYIIKKRGIKERIVRATSMQKLNAWCEANGYNWVVAGMRSIAQMAEDDKAEIVA